VREGSERSELPNASIYDKLTPLTRRFARCRGSGYSVTLKKGDTYNDGGSGRFLFDAVMGSSLPSALPDSVITLGREVRRNGERSDELTTL